MAGKQTLNPLTGNFDLVNNKANEILLDNGQNLEEAIAQTVLPTYTTQNITEVRNIDSTTATLGDTVNVLGTLIQDVKNGVKGEPGEQGVPGVKGDKGEPGEQGVPGVKGDKGDPGEQGIPGVKGDKGDPGEQGIPGVKGVKGDTGNGVPYGGNVGEIIKRGTYGTERSNDLTNLANNNLTINGVSKPLNSSSLEFTVSGGTTDKTLVAGDDLWTGDFFTVGSDGKATKRRTRINPTYINTQTLFGTYEAYVKSFCRIDNTHFLQVYQNTNLGSDLYIYTNKVVNGTVERYLIGTITGLKPVSTNTVNSDSIRLVQLNATNYALFLAVTTGTLIKIGVITLAADFLSGTVPVMSGAVGVVGSHVEVDTLYLNSGTTYTGIFLYGAQASTTVTSSIISIDTSTGTITFPGVLNLNTTSRVTNTTNGWNQMKIKKSSGNTYLATTIGSTNNQITCHSLLVSGTSVYRGSTTAIDYSMSNYMSQKYFLEYLPNFGLFVLIDSIGKLVFIKGTQNLTSAGNKVSETAFNPSNFGINLCLGEETDGTYFVRSGGVKIKIKNNLTIKEYNHGDFFLFSNIFVTILNPYDIKFTLIEPYSFRTQSNLYSNNIDGIVKKSGLTGTSVKVGYIGESINIALTSGPYFFPGSVYALQGSGLPGTGVGTTTSRNAPIVGRAVSTTEINTAYNTLM